MRSSSNGSAMLAGCCGIPLLLVLVCALAGYFWVNRPGPPKAYVRIKRFPSKPGYLGFGKDSKSVDVLVNNETIGSLTNGELHTFAYAVNAQTNTLQITCGNDVSKPIEIDPQSNGATSLVCRYMDSQDAQGYFIALRSPTEDELPQMTTVKILSVSPDKQYTAEEIHTYDPITLPAGIEKTITQSTTISEDSTIIDQDSVARSTMVDFKGGVVFGMLGLQAERKDEVIKTKTGTKIVRKGGQRTQTQTLIIHGDGKPHTLYWRENFETGMEKAVINGKPTEFRYKKPVDLMLLSR